MHRRRIGHGAIIKFQRSTEPDYVMQVTFLSHIYFTAKKDKDVNFYAQISWPNSSWRRFQIRYQQLSINNPVFQTVYDAFR